jgi:hypothetical protein
VAERRALEVQEYVAPDAAIVARHRDPSVLQHDIVEQFDAIGVGSLTVVLLTGLFTGAAWRCRAARRWTSSARARWSAAGQRVDDQGTRAGVDRADADRADRIGHRRRARLDDGTDQINALRALGPTRFESWSFRDARRLLMAPC